jgi:membrane protease YdiL (CAAX protease family)
LLTTLSIGFVWLTQMASVIAGLDLMPVKLAELALLLGLSVIITSIGGGRRAVRALFAGLTRWRIGWRYLLVLAAMPLLTVLVAAATGTLRAPAQGWLDVALMYVAFLVLGAITANLWEETVWSGFIQQRLTVRYGLLRGALLTAVPFALIHLPLAFETRGWSGTTWSDVGITWSVLVLAAPFLRYLIGTLLADTGGSTLAAGLMHASFNAAGAMLITDGGWQYVPALVILTLLVAAGRAVLRGTTAHVGRLDRGPADQRGGGVAR